MSVIACSQLNQQGNNIANVLFNYLEYESLGDSETLLIPIQDHMHWVGLRVDIRDKAIVKVSYFDSNRGENYDYREDERYEEIRKQLRENNFIGNEEELTIPPRCMQQPDGSSCGAWLIENFYVTSKDSGTGRNRKPLSSENCILIPCIQKGAIIMPVSLQGRPQGEVQCQAKMTNAMHMV